MPIFSYLVLPVFSFEYMAIWAVGAFLFFYFPEIIKSYLNKFKHSYFFLLGLILVLLSFKLTHLYLQSILLSILFILLILNTVVSDAKIIFKSKLFSSIGKISYGVYMYHPFIMFLIFPIANVYFKTNLIIYNLFIYVLITGISILLSHLSYKYFELKFIKIKDTKFSTLWYHLINLF
jgi:peptidoglycan/LPS O-acetylase OafA/YrhL